MPAVITCPKCKTKFKLPDNLIGKAIKCSSCGTALKTKAPAAKSQAGSQAAANPQPPTAELAKLGLDGPIRRQPDVFAGAAPVNRQSPDLLGNLAAEPGFADAATVQGEAPPKERPADDLSEIFENPYLSPSAAGKGGSRKFAGDSNYQYRPLKLWAVLVSTGVALHCLLTFGMTSVAYFLLPSVEAVDASAEEELVAQALYYAAVLLGLVASWFAVYIFTAVMVCIFMVQANKNVRALGASDLSISPGWSAGWWFIPIANLVKPVQAMSEIYRASIKPRGKAWKKISTPATVGVWWTFWLLANLLSSFEGQEYVNEELLGEAGFTALVWGSSTCLMISGIMLIMIVFGIASKQTEQAA